MTKSDARAIHEEVNAAMAVIAEKRGLVFRKANARFGSDSFGTKVEFAEVNGSGAATAEELDWKRSAHLFGLDPLFLGMTFTDYSGRTFKVVGLKPRSKKYPVLAENVATGKRFKFGAATVKNRMASPE